MHQKVSTHSRCSKTSAVRAVERSFEAASKPIQCLFMTVVNFLTSAPAYCMRLPRKGLERTPGGCEGTLGKNFSTLARRAHSPPTRGELRTIPEALTSRIPQPIDAAECRVNVRLQPAPTVRDNRLKRPLAVLLTAGLQVLAPSEEPKQAASQSTTSSVLLLTSPSMFFGGLGYPFFSPQLCFGAK